MDGLKRKTTLRQFATWWSVKPTKE